jgi:hypothetical protein
MVSKGVRCDMEEMKTTVRHNSPQSPLTLRGEVAEVHPLGLRGGKGALLL